MGSGDMTALCFTYVISFNLSPSRFDAMMYGHSLLNARDRHVAGSFAPSLQKGGG